jgi:hypothetical protein
MTGKENGTRHTIHTIWGSMGSQKGYSSQLDDKLLNNQDMLIKNLLLYGLKKG